MSAPQFQDVDFGLAERCLTGEASALQSLQAICDRRVKPFLISTGASEEDASEIVQSLCSDCIAGPPGKPPLLRKYLGHCALHSWLSRVAINRLVSVHRRRQVERERFGPESALDEVASSTAPDGEEPIIAMMRAALEKAFHDCGAEHFVMMHLVHAGELKLEEVARMFRCSIATISRQTDRACGELRAATLRHLKVADPWLDLRWEDFLALCEAAPLGCVGADQA